eukprot:scpid85437/ scgid5618/ 
MYPGVVFPLKHVGLCNNVPASGWAFGGKYMTPSGVCVIVQMEVDSPGSGQWMVVVNKPSSGSLVQHHANISVQFGDWVEVSLATTALGFKASVNSDTVVNSSCTDCATYESGYVALTSGWHWAKFDDFNVSAERPPPPPPNSWIQQLSIGGATRRNDFTGPVGAAIQATATVTAHSLGRYYGHENGNGQHHLRLYQVSANKTIADVVVNGAGQVTDSLGFIYQQLSPPVVLQPGEKYYFTSEEITGSSDYFFGQGDDNPTAQTVEQLQLVDSVYYFQGAWDTIGDSGSMYGPLNILLH